MRHTILLALIATLALLLAPAAQADPPPFAQFASGVVFHDQNGNGTRDEGEPGIADVRVSNQLQVTTTDAEGRWRLPVSPDTRIFVVKPRNWRTPVSAENLPRFHYNYKPQGSPTSKFGGVAATGDLPDEIDFALVPHAEPDRFSAIFFADTQPYTIEQVDYVAHDVVEPLIADHHEARFGVTLGDIVGDDLNLYGPLNRAIGRIGIPWYNVFGNHDANYDVTRDEDSDETFERVFAPNYYSWDCGKVHFIATDGVDQNGRRYIGHLGERQLKWIENDLAHVPDDMLVVLLMHIPLLTDGRGASVNVDDRHALYRLIEHRTHVLALAGHMHRHDHRFIGEEDDWHGKQPLEQVYIVTVSGNWWSGEKDARGIPDARMSDGGPNGYMLAMFDGASHKLQYRAASRPADYQMDIHAPHAVFTDRLAQTAVFVNVFDGSPRSVVEMQINAGEWKAIPQVRRGGAELQRLLADLGQPPYDTSTHLWRTTLPVDTPPGSAAIRIRTTDCYGQVFHGSRIIRVIDAAERPVLDASETPVLRPGQAAVLKVKQLRGDIVKVHLPIGSEGETVAAPAVRIGNVLRVGVPANVVPGRLVLEGADYVRGDPQVFELAPADGSPGGLRATMWRASEVPKGLPAHGDQMPDAIRRDATIDFGDQAAFGLPFEVTNVAIEWTGWLRVPAAGEYTFTLESDDGSALWINRDQLIDNDGVHSRRAKTGTAELPEGLVPIHLAYFQGAGNACCRLLWTPPGASEAVVIPADALVAELPEGE